MDILVANIEGLDILDTEEQLLMGNGLLGEESYLIEDLDHPKDQFVGLESAGGAPEGGTIQLSQGDITDSIACGICIKCNREQKTRRANMWIGPMTMSVLSQFALSIRARNPTWG